MKTKHNSLFETIIILVALAMLFGSCTLPRLRSKPVSSQQAPHQPRSETQNKKVPGTAENLDPNSPRDQFIQESLDHFERSDFTWLEETANKARKKKERFPGGYWKLFSLFEGVERYGKATGDWEGCLSRLREWKAAYPNSITARVAMAAGWEAYAWDARGHGYSNTVSDSESTLFEQRIIEAKKELIAAKDLEPKCPEWYTKMLLVGLGEGWPKEEFDAVYNEGAAVEPNYFMLHSVKANYLLPRWYGEGDDWFKFADATATTVGGDDGKLLYFLFAANMAPVYQQRLYIENDLDWGKIKEGFQILKTRFGVDNYRLNQYLMLASYAADYSEMNAALGEVADKWDVRVWRSEKRFMEAKSIATANVNTPGDQIAFQRKMNPRRGTDR